jgi:hypothetical protein
MTNTLDRLANGRTDLVFDHVAAGHAATADANGARLIQVVCSLRRRQRDPVSTHKWRISYLAGTRSRSRQRRISRPLEALSNLLKAGAVVDVRDTHGDSPLSWASWHTRPDAILRLLGYGDFYIRPDRGSTFDHGMGWGFMETDLLGNPRAA